MSDEGEEWIVDAIRRSPHGRVEIEAHAKGMPFRKRFIFEGTPSDPLPYRPGQVFHIEDLPPLLDVQEDRRL